MSVITEIESVESFINTLYPAAHTVKEDIPEQPTADTFGIRLFSSSTDNETALHYRLDRSFQIVYFGATPSEVLSRMDALGHALYGVQVLPIDDSTRYLRVGSFDYTALFQTENDLFARIGVLDCTVRQARSQPQYDQIQHIYARYMTRVKV